MINQKRKPYRNKKMIEACREENGMCFVNLPGCQGYGPTVAAHSNRAEDGKGKGQKADDFLVSKSCTHCHDALDGRKRIKSFEQDTFYMPQVELDWYHDRGIKRTIRYFLDKGIIK